MSSIAHSWNGSGLTLGYSYNQNQQRSGLNISDRSYRPLLLPPRSTAYTANNLNQYTSTAATGAGTSTLTYDKRGNLNTDGSWTYLADKERRLISASKQGTTATYSYDPFGRRLSKTLNDTTTAFLSYGDQQLADYVGGGGTVSFNRMFVYGAGLDEPVVSVAVGGARTYYF